jgi:hypothetical protein
MRESEREREREMKNVQHSGKVTEGWWWCCISGRRKIITGIKNTAIWRSHSLIDVT